MRERRVESTDRDQSGLDRFLKSVRSLFGPYR